MHYQYFFIFTIYANIFIFLYMDIFKISKLVYFFRICYVLLTFFLSIYKKNGKEVSDYAQVQFSLSKKLGTDLFGNISYALYGMNWGHQLSSSLKYTPSFFSGGFLPFISVFFWGPENLSFVSGTFFSGALLFSISDVRMSTSMRFPLSKKSFLSVAFSSKSFSKFRFLKSNFFDIFQFYSCCLDFLIHFSSF